MSIAQLKFFLLLIFGFSFSSCLIAQETLNWTNNIPPGGWPNGSLGPHSNSTQCNSRGTLTAQINNPLGLTLPGTTPFPSGVNSNSLILGMSAAPNTQGISETINFTYPIENLSFSIFDIDGNTGNWQDRLIITASLSGSNVPVTIDTCPTAAGTTCTGSGTLSAQVDAGTTPTGFTAASGRADFSVAGSLDSLTIQYQNHNVPVSTTQFISLTQLTYSCAIIGTSKIMTRRAGQAFGVSPYIVDIDFNFENFGDLPLTDLSAFEDLNAVFNIAPNSENFSVTSISTTSGPVSFSANGTFDGDSDTQLIGAGSSLAPGETASIRVSLLVNNYDDYTNSISVTATTPQSALTSDDSTNGTIPDGADGDDNPDESSSSPLNVSTLPVSLNHLSSTTIDNKTTIRWQTDIEYDHIGFSIFQENDQGEKIQRSPIINQPNQSKDQALKSYAFSFNKINNNPLWLAEYSKNAEITWYGPLTDNSEFGEKINANKPTMKRTENRIITEQNPNEFIAVETIQQGMHRITYQDLLSSGMDLSNKSPQNILITYKDKPVAIHINGNTQNFDNTTSIDFYATNFSSLYTDKKIYRLAFDPFRSRKISSNHSAPSTIIDGWYWHTEKYNPNLIYDFSSPTNDPWRAETLATFSNREKNITFPLDELAENSGETIQLSLQLSGGIDYQQPPDFYPSDPNRCGASAEDIYPGLPNDHCVSVKANHHDLQDIVFDGLTVTKAEYELNEAFSASGVLDISLNLPGETGFDHDIVNIENITITYPRKTTAIDNVFNAQLNTAYHMSSDLINLSHFETQQVSDSVNRIASNVAAFTIEGFTEENIVAYAIESGLPTKINQYLIHYRNNQFIATIPHISQSNKYWVSTEASLLKPTLSTWHNAEEIIDPTTEYIMIAHPDFIDAAMPLKAYHESNGLKVKLVNVFDIYAHYSHAIVDPLAIKNYIYEMARYNQLKYVLLIGSDNYDYKGYLSTQNFSHIPSIYTAIDDIVRYTPTDSLFTDLDGDDVPDIAIGRLPSRTVDELNLLINKQMNFMSEENSINSSAHFIADAEDENYSYANISNELISLMPVNWSNLSTYRDEFSDANSTKQQILNYFSNSPKLTAYLGHSGPRNWFSFPSAFTYNDIANLENTQSASVVLQWGCWNSYYVEPSANTMAHRFLFNNDKGAVAVFGASALTLVESETAFAKLILPELMQSNQSIGSAMLNAKKSLAQNGEFRDIIIGWNLLGDPAIILNNNP